MARTENTPPMGSKPWDLTGPPVHPVSQSHLSIGQSISYSHASQVVFKDFKIFMSDLMLSEYSTALDAYWRV